MPTAKDPNAPEPGAALVPNPDVVNEFHRYSDVDNGPEAQHHTLGPEAYQSAPGNHGHPLLSKITDFIDKTLTTNQTMAGKLVTPGLTAFDTRSTNPTPTELDTLLKGGYGVRFDFKLASTVGLNTILGIDIYIGVMYFAPWGDDTGQGSYILAFCPPSAALGPPRIYVRYGLRSSGWGSWGAL